MKDVSRQARRIVEGWPDGGWIVGVLPDASVPEWSGEATLDLVETAADFRGHTLLLDLAPSATDLVSRFRATGRPGFGESAAGEADLDEITRRNDERGVSYLPNGLKTAGRVLASSDSASELAERVRRADGALFVILDRNAAEAAASAGWLDGLVRLGDTPGDGGPLPGDLTEWGRIEHDEPDPSPASEAATGRKRGMAGWGDQSENSKADPRPSWAGEPKAQPRVILPRDESSGNWLKKIGSGLVVVAFLIVVLVSAASVLEGPPWDAINGMVAAVTSSGDRPPPVETTGGVAGDGPRTRQQPSFEAAEVPTAGGGEEGRVGATAESDGDTATGSSAADGGVAPDAQQNPTAEGGTEESAAATQPAPGTREIRPSPESRSPPSSAGAERAANASSNAGSPLIAVSDSLVGRVRSFFVQEVRFREGEIDCAELAEAYQRADRLFVRLSAHFMERQASLDSAERAAYNDRAEDMDAVDRSFRSSGCPRP